MSKLGHSFRMISAVGLALGALGLGGCAASSSPRDDFLQVRSVVYGSHAGDGTVVMSSWPGPQMAAKLDRQTAGPSTAVAAAADH
jgi:hypothetical protein